MESSIGIDFGLDGLGDVTTFHVGSTNGIYLFLTPLAFSAVSSLLADIGANVSFELRQVYQPS